MFLLRRPKKRRASILSITIIVMLLLGVLSGAVFGLAYINRRSAEQQLGLYRARTAARSIFYSVASVISDDLEKPDEDRRIKSEHLQEGRTGTLNDGDASATVGIGRSGRTVTISGDVRYGEWRSGQMRLEMRLNTAGNAVEKLTWH